MEDREEVSPGARESRRNVIKRMAYVAPVVLTLAAFPAFARSGSACHPHEGLCD